MSPLRNIVTNWRCYDKRLLGQCVGLKSGAKWKNMRSHFDPEFSHSSSNKMVAVCQREVDAWLQSLSGAHTAEYDQRRFTVRAKEGCEFLPFRLISMNLYGEAFNDQVGVVERVFC